nr:serine protease [Terrabacter sp. MAHUQ-38]
MPIVLIDEDRELRVNGTAVCIGPGTFVTARHVVDYLLDVRPQGNDAEVWIAWTSGPGLLGTANAFRGQMLSVKRYRRHPRVDLAVLTTALPAGAVGQLATVRWSLRMPALGEPVALLGYPAGKASADITEEGPTGVALEYPLMLGFGSVTGHNELWGPNPNLPRSWPGFETDAPMPGAMSGGAVIDQHNRLIGFSSSSQKPNPPEHSSWSGYVNMAGFLLGMDVDVPQGDGTFVPLHVAELVGSGVMSVDVDPTTFYIDDYGNPTYRPPETQ